MAWQELGNFTLTNQWQFTSNVTGEIFRIKHSPIQGITNQRPRAVVSQAFLDSENQINTFDTRVLAYREEIDCFTFYFPRGVSEHSIAIKRLDSLDLIWNLSIETFEANSIQQQIQISPYSELIYLLSTPEVTSNMVQDLLPVSQSVTLQQGFTVQPLVPANANRAYLSIRAGSSPVYIWTETKDPQTNQHTTILAEIDKGATWPLPRVNDGIYKGGIYAQVTKNVAVDWTEYSYPEAQPQ